MHGLPFEHVKAPLWVAVFACVGGIAWRAWGASYLGVGVVFNSEIVTSDLHVAGPYRFTRNPLYLGLGLYALGIALIGPPLTVAIVLAGISTLQYALIVSEETRLRARFGERYEAYVRAVPRLLPSLTPRVPDSGAKPSLAIGLRAETLVIAIACVSFISAFALGR